MSKESFKNFVHRNTYLANDVINGKTTWQKLYELYDMYGEDSSVWSKYKVSSGDNGILHKISLADSNIKEMINMVKKVDVDKLRQGIDGIQKAIGLIQDLGISNKGNMDNGYKSRGSYNHMDD